MSFLNPTLLGWLLPALFLPLLIHLLNKKFPKLFSFSSVENLRKTLAQRSKWLRFRHLILLLLRTAALGLLLVAFLKPVLPRLGSGAQGASVRHVLLVLDHSLSMEHRAGSMPLRKRAMVEAEKILDTLGADDLVNVMIVDQSPTTCFVDFSDNHAAARRFVMTLRPGLGRADFNQANAAIAQRLGTPNAASEIYYLSDFQRKTWANVDFRSVPGKARLFFVDVSSGTRENKGILSAEVRQAHVLTGNSVTIDLEIGNFSQATLEDRLTVVCDQQNILQKQVTAPPWSSAKLSLPIDPGAPGLHLCEFRLSSDDLPEDNARVLALNVLEQEEVLIVSDDPNSLESGAFFLQTALNPYEKARGSLSPKPVPSSEISPVTLAGVGKVFITKAGRMDETTCAALGKFLFQGGGLVYFLDGPADTENLARFEKVIGAGTMPLKLGPRRAVENIAAGSQQIGKGDFSSPFLRLFRGSIRHNLGLLEFYDYYQTAATGAPSVILSYTDESPAMAAVNYGMGTMLLMNFSLSENASNLARQRLFPAWIQEIVKNLSVEQAPMPGFAVGDLVVAEVWKNEAIGSSFRAPNGAALQLRKEMTGDRCVISFAPDQLGFYTIQKQRLLHAYAVNAPAEESDLRQIDKTVLPTAFGAGQQGYFVDNRTDYGDLVSGKPVFHWFVAGALLFLLAETGFQWIVKSVSR